MSFSTRPSRMYRNRRHHCTHHWLIAKDGRVKRCSKCEQHKPFTNVDKVVDSIMRMAKLRK